MPDEGLALTCLQQELVPYRPIRRRQLRSNLFTVKSEAAELILAPENSDDRFSLRSRVLDDRRSGRSIDGRSVLDRLDLGRLVAVTISFTELLASKTLRSCLIALDSAYLTGNTTCFDFRLLRSPPIRFSRCTRSVHHHRTTSLLQEQDN